MSESLAPGSGKVREDDMHTSEGYRTIVGSVRIDHEETIIIKGNRIGIGEKFFKFYDVYKLPNPLVSENNPINPIVDYGEVAKLAGLPVLTTTIVADSHGHSMSQYIIFTPIENGRVVTDKSIVFDRTKKD